MVQMNAFVQGSNGDNTGLLNKKVKKDFNHHSKNSLNVLKKDTLSFTGSKDDSTPVCKSSSIKSRLREATIYLTLAVSTMFGVHSTVENQRLAREVTNVQRDVSKAQDNVNSLTDKNISLLRDLEAQRLKLSQQDGQLQKLRANSLDNIMDVVTRVSPSTVRVEVTGEGSLGSGVIFFDKEGQGYILTNSHVTGNKTYNKDPNDDNFKYTVKLYSGGDTNKPVEFKATFLKVGKKSAESKDHDLAVLVIPKGVKLPDDVKGIQFRDIEKDPLKPGEIVVSFGNPFGFKDCISIGFISTPDRKLEDNPNKYLQVDGAINPGNSGGATVDKDGNLVGLNQLMWHGIPGDGNNVSQMIRIDTILEYLKSLGIKIDNN